MDGAEILAALDKMTKKRKLDPAKNVLDELIELIEAFSREEASASGRTATERARLMAELMATINAPHLKGLLQAHHKEAVSCATKLGKAADKALAASVDAAVPPEAIKTLEPRLVHIAIRQHLLVSGRFDVAQRFGEACGLTPASPAARIDADSRCEHATSALKSPSAPADWEEVALRRMHTVRQAVLSGEMAPLLSWLEEHAHELAPHAAAQLSFDAHQLEYVRLLKAGEVKAALGLLRTHLTAAAHAATRATVAHVAASREAAPLRSREDPASFDLPPGNAPASAPAPSCSALPHPLLRAAAGAAPPPAASLPAAPWAAPSAADSRLRQLAGALAYAHRLDGSPYAALLDEPKLRAAVLVSFERECLARLGLPSKPALATCVSAGLQALPKLAKLAGVLKHKYVQLCGAASTLPLDLDLGPAFAYHSTFTCPISKELATPGNPPMLLPCGHVLALASVTKLARSSRNAQFKCPYCPAESTSADAQALLIT